MKFKIKRIKPLRLWHVIFEKQTDMTLSFLRVQEYCESPKFRNKQFDLDEYIQWYSEKYKQAFDYHIQVGAHNIPGDKFEEFMIAHEDDNMLSVKERKILNRLWDKIGSTVFVEETFYIIATCKNLPDHNGYFDHEFRHGLFYLLPEYRRDILAVLKKYTTNRDVKKFRNALAKDYGTNVLYDEVHAYALTSYNPYNEAKRIRDLPKGLQALRSDLKEVEKKYYKNGKVV